MFEPWCDFFFFLGLTCRNYIMNGSVFWVEKAGFMDVIDLNVCLRPPLELGYFSCGSFPRVVWDTEVNIKLLAGFLPFF